MDDEPEKPVEIKSDGIPKPVIPPPNLTPPPPPPRSPLDSGPRPSSAPPPIPPGDPSVRVKFRSSGDDEDAPIRGAVPFNTRLTAAAIDTVVFIGIIIGLQLVLPAFADRLAYLIALGYLITRDSLPFLGGQSVGKKAMKIKAVTLEGKSLVGNWETALIRNGVLIIPLFGLIELYILLTREEKPERGRRLGDEWAKTKVIFEEKPVSPDDDSGPPSDAISR
jgi:uncharacterized RDD family membrane protein YckC